jgi:putative oligomerization/nucleic acid binding protein/phospholipase D-like protein
MLASSFSFLDVMWSMIVFFCWILWFWLLFTVWVDVFRRHDASGWAKAGWLIFTIVLPFLGVFIYLIVESKGMAERNMAQAKSQQQQFDQYVRQAASSTDPASQIETAKKLFDSGAITQAEYDTLKQKALA